MRRKKFSKKAIARMYGFRSGLEQEINESFQTMGLDSEYEKHILKYIKPVSEHKYCPDFRIVNSKGEIIFVETKGRWVTQDRQKMKLIKQQYPELDIRIIFQNAESRISKTSKTTYGQVATKMGYKWCDYRSGIPESWIEDFQ